MNARAVSVRIITVRARRSARIPPLQLRAVFAATALWNILVLFFFFSGRTPFKNKLDNSKNVLGKSSLSLSLSRFEIKTEYYNNTYIFRVQLSCLLSLCSSR